MKKIIVLLITTLMLLSLVACIIETSDSSYTSSNNLFDQLVDERQVPVYEGMTVSSINDKDIDIIIQEKTVKMNKFFKKVNLNPEGCEYYADLGEEIFIEIHINNPDSFEILSFTINGEKYSSYMFEDGSDLETIIIKCNVGHESGIKEYTIDAIKYIDKQAIKTYLFMAKKQFRYMYQLTNISLCQMIISHVSMRIKHK